jgi:hypothetical protein
VGGRGFVRVKLVVFQRSADEARACQRRPPWAANRCAEPLAPPYSRAPGAAPAYRSLAASLLPSLQRACLFLACAPCTCIRPHWPRPAAATRAPCRFGLLRLCNLTSLAPLHMSPLTRVTTDHRRSLPLYWPLHPPSISCSPHAPALAALRRPAHCEQTAHARPTTRSPAYSGLRRYASLRT